MTEKTAVILFNLGGPDRLSAVRPFLFNLFNDPAIIRLPQPLRFLLAMFISLKRNSTAQHIYSQIGGKSPIAEETQKQAESLEQALQDAGEYRVFYAMRYWHPRAEKIVRDVKEYMPARIILLPLYPQFSTTTTASSIREWNEAAARAKLSVPTTAFCCYPTQPELVAAHTHLIRNAYFQAAVDATPRILFSAHGLPKKISDSGDPYKWQVEQTVSAITQTLAIDNLDYVICYQSRVGRLEWIGPSTESELERAGRDRIPVVVVPVSFVSEHSETLVELDIEYAKLAESAGIPLYVRAPALGVEEMFIAGLARLCKDAQTLGSGTHSGGVSDQCRKTCVACPRRNRKDTEEVFIHTNFDTSS